MKEKAGMVGQRIRAVGFANVVDIFKYLSFQQEDGVRTAIHNIYTYFPRASSEGITPE